MSKGESVIPIKTASPWTAEQYATLNALLDMMIPASADGQMPAASTLGLFDDASGFAKDTQTKDAQTKDDLRVLTAGLDATNMAANSQFGKPLGRLDAAQAKTVVDELRVSSAAFFELLTQHTVARYYEHERVLKALGVEPTAPWPRGHSVEDGDWSLLDSVKDRAPIYRST
ncbi:MAG: gluconate 2-dehydrogenase subunit 3 family protein [Burkholderiaceae bacterium]